MICENEKKRVLIVGANSYIGESFHTYANGRLDVDVVNSYEGWRQTPFDGYDSVLMVAGIAHQKQTAANKDSYFAINRDLAIVVATKAKASGVGQFVYLSSMAVYGLLEGGISENTNPSPRENDFYGMSKYQAEKELMLLTNVSKLEYHNHDMLDISSTQGKTLDMQLCVIRPPMVYGIGCPGKYSTLIKVAKVLPIIPKFDNKRSMICINNLSELLCTVIEKSIAGVLLPHDSEYANTTNLLVNISKTMGKRRLVIPGFGWLIRLCMRFSPTLKTAFGSLYYK